MEAFRILFLSVCLSLAVSSCSSPPEQKQKLPAESRGDTTVKTKPPSSFPDTLKIDFAAAVFFVPDSMQLEKIKSITKAPVFESTMHEYFYQQRNARIFLKQYWPMIRIIEAKNIRFLQFINTDRSDTLIDLDKIGDACGMFVFNAKKPPRMPDMMNVETEVPAYFSR